MQLMIDIATESTEGLRLAGQFLLDHAALKHALEHGGEPRVPAGTFSATGSRTTDLHPASFIPPAPVANERAVADFVPPPPPSDVVVPFRDPRDNPQRGHSDAGPFVPPPPPAPAPSATLTAPPAAPTPPAPTSAPTVTTPMAAAAATLATVGELDDSGMPWDARIHLKNKSKKKGGTWKMQRGLESAFVEQVTQELHARMINSSAVPMPPAEVAAPSFPGGNGSVPVPPPPALAGGSGQSPVLPSQPGSAGGVPVPPAPTNGGVPVPPPPVSVQPAGAVPVPPAPVLGVPDGSSQTGGSFRELVSKITALRQANRLTAEQVTGIVQQAGAPSLQMLNSMPHLIPEVNTLVDAAVAMT